MKYKNYYNYELGNRDIYSHNDILGMTVQDLFDNELPLSYQYNTIGIPKDDELTASPNTHQYTSANGKLRWRSSSKTTEELLEEERQRNQELQAQTEAAQSQLGTMAGSQAPVSNTPKQAVESPMMETEPLFDKQSLQAMGGLINKAKEKIQAKKEANAQADAELYDLIFGSPEDELEDTFPEDNLDMEPGPTSSPNLLKRLGKNLKTGIQNLFAGLNEDVTDVPLESFRANDPEIRNYLIDPNNANIAIEENPNARLFENFKKGQCDDKYLSQNPFNPLLQQGDSTQAQSGADDYLNQELTEEELKQIGQEISGSYKASQKRAKQNRSLSGAENPSEMLFDLNAQKTDLSQSLKNYLRNHSKTYRNYEGLTPIEAGQKWASKFLSPLTAREYYGIASRLHDDGKPSKKQLRDNDFYKLDDIHNEETRNLIQKNMIKNLDLDPNDPATYEKIKDINVVVPKTSSHLYELVKNSDELADFVANNYEAMKGNPGKMVKDSLEYARPTRDKSNGGFWDKTNRYAVYKKADIGAKMNPDGSILITHPDTYDFSHMDIEKESGINKLIAYSNNIAHSQQEKGQISKFSLTNILTLTPEEIQELLERSKKRKNNK